MRKFATALLVAALGAGCVHITEVPQGAAPRMVADAVVYVNAPEPDRFEAQEFPESGTQVARAVSVALQFRGARFVVASTLAAPEENQIATGATIDSSEISGKSSWATLGGDHPQDLLPDPLALWAARLFQPGSR